MSGALPEVTEADASGLVAEIYADIRRSLKVDNVNLIYRHFATIDGALPWAWAILQPHFASGQLAEWAQESRPRYQIVMHNEQDLANPVLTTKERRDIARTLDFYLKANPMNLFALQILSNALMLKTDLQASTNLGLVPPKELETAAHSEQFSSTNQELMFYVSQGAKQIRPTLLRQLEQWPHYVDAIADFVRTICCDSNFEQQIEAIHGYSATKVSKLGKGDSISNLNNAAMQDVGYFCSYFPIVLIRMTMIADSLRSKL